jgi:hypothetical protein
MMTGAAAASFMPSFSRMLLKKPMLLLLGRRMKGIAGPDAVGPGRTA